MLTHWGRVTHICVRKLTIIGSDDGLLPGQRQAIIWTNAGILIFGPLGSYFCEIVIEIDTFSFKKMHLKLSSVKWRPSCLGLNVLIGQQVITWTYKHWVHCCQCAMNKLWWVNNTSKSIGRKWKHIYDQHGWVQKLPRTKENCRNPYFWLQIWFRRWFPKSVL